MKMNKFFALAMAAATLAACSNDEEITRGRGDLMAINLGATFNVSASTRAVTDGDEMQDAAFKSGESVDIFIYESTTGTDNESTTYGTNGKLTYTTGARGALNPPSDQHWPSNSNSGIEVFGYYPSGTVVDAKSTENITFAVKTDQTNQTGENPYSNYKASDLMYGKASNPVTRTSDAVQVEFHHLLSKVNVELVAGTGLTTENLKGATVKLKTLRTNTLLNPSTGTLSDPETKTSSDITVLTVKGTGTGDAVTEGDLKGSAVVIPQEITGNGSDTFIEVTLNEELGGGVLNYKPASGTTITLAQSKKQTYTITVKLTGLTVTSNIVNWEDGTSGNGDATM